MASRTNDVPDEPPFLILHGDSDELLPPGRSQELYDQLRAAGEPATLWSWQEGRTPVCAPGR